jgi:hypothetical protein
MTLRQISRGSGDTGVDIEESNVGALGGEGEGDGVADALGSSDDDGCLSRQSQIHVRPRFLIRG